MQSAPALSGLPVSSRHAARSRDRSRADHHRVYQRDLVAAQLALLELSGRGAYRASARTVGPSTHRAASVMIFGCAGTLFVALQLRATDSTAAAPSSAGCRSVPRKPRAFGPVELHEAHVARHLETRSRATIARCPLEMRDDHVRPMAAEPAQKHLRRDRSSSSGGTCARLRSPWQKLAKPAVHLYFTRASRARTTTSPGFM